MRNSRFEPLDATLVGRDWPAESISMNYGTALRDARARDPILVYGYNRRAGDDFKVYYSYQAPQTVAPCHETLPGIGGWVCGQ